MSSPTHIQPTREELELQHLQQMEEMSREKLGLQSLQHMEHMSREKLMLQQMEDKARFDRLLKRGSGNYSWQEFCYERYRQYAWTRAWRKVAELSPEQQTFFLRVETEIFADLPSPWQAAIRAHDDDAALRRATGQPPAKQAARPRL